MLFTHTATLVDGAINQLMALLLLLQLLSGTISSGGYLKFLMRSALSLHFMFFIVWRVCSPLNNTLTSGHRNGGRLIVGKACVSYCNLQICGPKVEAKSQQLEHNYTSRQSDQVKLHTKWERPFSSIGLPTLGVKHGAEFRPPRPVDFCLAHNGAWCCSAGVALYCNSPWISRVFVCACEVHTRSESCGWCGSGDQLIS